MNASLTLPSSRQMPTPGFGVYKSFGDRCFQSCATALTAGYRHIDTGQFYNNESQVGDAVRQSGIPRQDVFLTTKILMPEGGFDDTYRQCLESVRMLDSENGYVDLFLIHSPHRGPDGRKLLWQVLEALHANGKAKSIGVSNFGIQHIEELKQYAKIWPPHVNQIEVRANPSQLANRSM